MPIFGLISCRLVCRRMLNSISSSCPRSQRNLAPRSTSFLPLSGSRKKALCRKLEEEKNGGEEASGGQSEGRSSPHPQRTESLPSSHCSDWRERNEDSHSFFLYLFLFVKIFPSILLYSSLFPSLFHPFSLSLFRPLISSLSLFAFISFSCTSNSFLRFRSPSLSFVSYSLSLFCRFSFLS